MIQPNLLYVLVSSDDDLYLEQAFISMYSAKYHMPNAHITLLTDKATESTLTNNRKKEVQYADDIISVDLDTQKYNARQRSRILKTSARQYVKGDYLYIDCDTIIIKPLPDFSHFTAPIMACWDTHSAFKDNPYRDMCLRHGHLLDWPIDDEEAYFNSGILFVKDDSISHDFYKKWNENLVKGFGKGVFMDQPSLAKTNYETGHVIKRLDDLWNCELKHGVRFMKDAYIWHYLCTNKSKNQQKQLFILNENSILMNIKRTAVISDEIKQVVIDPFSGLAEVTHCFAGDDVYYFQTPLHWKLRSIYKTRLFTILEKVLLTYYKIRQIISL
jgi:hypothetical protein